jgi:4-amino-4-deoxy-L-arabinose transferase-like glycosyltransferase
MQDLASPAHEPTPAVSSARASGESRWLAPLLIALATFAFIAPTLAWLEFSSGSENLNVATALEILREERWLLPTLDGEPRVAKPPLTAWITAAAVDDDTFAGMSSRDAAVRAAAERQLAWRVRWPFLLASCVMLLATAELGRVLSGGDARVAAVAAAACASNLFFLRHGRLATTDVQLALWVALANVALAHAFMRGRWWRGAIGAGFFLGLAFMSKGPVALVQSVAPVAVFLLWDAWLSRKREPAFVAATDASPWGARFLQVLLAIAVFALVALPWYAVVASRDPDVWARWQMEVTREGATDLPPGKPYAYLSFFAFIAPWTAFLIAGIAVIVRDTVSPLSPSPGTPGEGWGEDSRRARTISTPTSTAPNPHPALSRSTGRGEMPPAPSPARGMLLAMLMLVVPILVMSFFRDRKERYLLPMIVPAGVVVARAVVEHLDTRHLKNAADRAVVAIHWVTLLVIAIGLPIAGVAALKTFDGGKWFSPTVAIVGGGACLAIVLAGLRIHRRWGGGLVAATLLLMLAMQVLFMHGYRHSREGRSEMKPLAAMIWQQTPDAVVYITGAKKVRAPVDLAIYLNRSALWVDDVSQIPRDDARPRVVVTRQRRREPAPEPPPGATVIGKTQRDENWWHAFLLAP